MNENRKKRYNWRKGENVYLIVFPLTASFQTRHSHRATPQLRPVSVLLSAIARNAARMSAFAPSPGRWSEVPLVCGESTAGSLVKREQGCSPE